MPFKVIKSPTFLHEVTISVPIDGGFSEERLSTKFRVIPREELRNIPDPTDAGSDTFFDTFLDKAVVTFENLQDDAGKEMKCTPDLRAQLLGIPYIRSAIIRQYQTAMDGAARKN